MTNNTPKHSRSEQSRINGAKSKGPTSPEGKAISSQNALKHGFAAAINNVLCVEDKEAFELHVAGYRAAFTPQNYLEETLVDQLASVNWRQTRLAGIETAIVDAQLAVQADEVEASQPNNEVDPYCHLVYAWQSLARKTKMPEDPAALPATFDLHCLELVRRYITTFDRQYRNTLLNLRQYRKDFAPPQPAPEPNEPKNVPRPTPAPAPAVVERPQKPAPTAPVPTPIRTNDVIAAVNPTVKIVFDSKERK